MTREEVKRGQGSDIVTVPATSGSVRSAASMNSLIQFGFIIEWALTIGIDKSDLDSLISSYKLFPQFMFPSLVFHVADQTTKSLARSWESENITRCIKWRIDQSCDDHLEFFPVSRKTVYFWLYIVDAEFQQPQKHTGNHYVSSLKVNCELWSSLSQRLGFTWQNRG